MNGSKSNTSSSKSSTEGGPAPQRFDVAAMGAVSAVREASAGGVAHASAAVCARAIARRQQVRLLCERLRVGDRWRGRARRRESAALWLVSARGGGACAAVVPGG